MDRQYQIQDFAGEGELKKFEATTCTNLYITGNLTTNSVSELILNNLLTIQYYLDSEADDILELLKAQ